MGSWRVLAGSFESARLEVADLSCNVVDGGWGCFLSSRLLVAKALLSGSFGSCVRALQRRLP